MSNSADQFSNLMAEIKISTLKLKSGAWKLSDYYFKMSDFFNQLEPHKGENYGSWFNFKKDAEELKQLAVKELKNEM